MSTPAKRKPARRRPAGSVALAGASSQRRKSRARRRYHQEKARLLGKIVEQRPRLRAPWGRLAALLAAAGMIALLIFLFVDDRFYVKTADIQGQRFSDPGEIYRLAGVHGYSVFWVNSQEAARRIETLPFVQRALVRPLLPGRLHIQVVEREPVAAWRVEGKDYWVDRAGVTLPVASNLSSVHLPLLEDRDGSSIRPRAASSQSSAEGGIDPQLVAALLMLHEQLPEIGQFAYDKFGGFHYIDSHGTQIFLGQPQGLAERLQLMQMLQASLVSQGQAPAEINFRHQGGFYYKPAPASAN